MKILRFNELITESLNDNFWKWFQGSKIANGKTPIICYHGTESIFDEFDIEKGRKWAKKVGFWFSDSKDMAEFYGNTMEVYLSIKNPKVITAAKFNSMREKYHNDESYWQKMKEEWINEGYDGLLVKGKDETFAGTIMKAYNIYAAFYPNQIKSVNNNGDFSLTSNNIYK